MNIKSEPQGQFYVPPSQSLNSFNVVHPAVSTAFTMSSFSESPSYRDSSSNFSSQISVTFDQSTKLPTSSQSGDPPKGDQSAVDLLGKSGNPDRSAQNIVASSSSSNMSANDSLIQPSLENHPTPKMASLSILENTVTLDDGNPYLKQLLPSEPGNQSLLPNSEPAGSNTIELSRSTTDLLGKQGKVNDLEPQVARLSPGESDLYVSRIPGQISNPVKIKLESFDEYQDETQETDQVVSLDRTDISNQLIKGDNFDLGRTTAGGDTLTKNDITGKSHVAKGIDNTNMSGPVITETRIQREEHLLSVERSMKELDHVEPSQSNLPSQILHAQRQNKFDNVSNLSNQAPRLNESSAAVNGTSESSSGYQHHIAESLEVNLEDKFSKIQNTSVSVLLGDPTQDQRDNTNNSNEQVTRDLGKVLDPVAVGAESQQENSFPVGIRPMAPVFLSSLHNSSSPSLSGKHNDQQEQDDSDSYSPEFIEPDINTEPSSADDPVSNDEGTSSPQSPQHTTIPTTSKVTVEKPTHAPIPLFVKTIPSNDGLKRTHTPKVNSVSKLPNTDSSSSISAIGKAYCATKSTGHTMGDQLKQKVSATPKRLSIKARRPATVISSSSESSSSTTSDSSDEINSSSEDDSHVTDKIKPINRKRPLAQHTPNNPVPHLLQKSKKVKLEPASTKAKTISHKNSPSTSQPLTGILPKGATVSNVNNNRVAARKPIVTKETKFKSIKADTKHDKKEDSSDSNSNSSSESDDSGSYDSSSDDSSSDDSSSDDSSGSSSKVPVQKPMSIPMSSSKPTSTGNPKPKAAKSSILKSTAAISKVLNLPVQVKKPAATKIPIKSSRSLVDTEGSAASVKSSLKVSVKTKALDHKGTIKQQTKNKISPKTNSLPISTSLASVSSASSNIILHLLQEKAEIKHRHSLKTLQSLQEIELENLKCQRELEDLQIQQQRELEDAKLVQRRKLQDLKQRHLVKIEKLKMQAKHEEAILTMDVQAKCVQAILAAQVNPSSKLPAARVDDVLNNVTKLFEP